MTDDQVVSHPHRQLMEEAEHERAVTESLEGYALVQALCRAIDAYSQFLDNQNLIWDWNDPETKNSAGGPRVKARALMAIIDYATGDGSIEIKLQDGPLERVYGNGTNPDYEGLGPPDIPHGQRPKHWPAERDPEPDPECEEFIAEVLERNGPLYHDDILGLLREFGCWPLLPSKVEPRRRAEFLLRLNELHRALP
jgi:hypothetical protein